MASFFAGTLEWSPENTPATARRSSIITIFSTSCIREIKRKMTLSHIHLQFLFFFPLMKSYNHITHLHHCQNSKPINRAISFGSNWNMGFFWKDREENRKFITQKNKQCPFYTGIVAHMFNSNQMWCQKQNKTKERKKRNKNYDIWVRI